MFFNKKKRQKMVYVDKNFTQIHIYTSKKKEKINLLLKFNTSNITAIGFKFSFIKKQKKNCSREGIFLLVKKKKFANKVYKNMNNFCSFINAVKVTVQNSNMAQNFCQTNTDIYLTLT